MRLQAERRLEVERKGVCVWGGAVTGDWAAVMVSSHCARPVCFQV